MPVENKAFKRHIIIDELNKMVYIEVQPNIVGEPITKEWEDIKQGRWQPYSPVEFQHAIAKAAASGWPVIPVWMNGYENVGYRVFGIYEMHKKGLIGIS